jgi:hypothetical protein
MADLNKFAYGALATDMLQKREDDKYVKGSLDALADRLDISEAGKGFIEGAYANHGSLKIAAEVYGNQHQKEMEGVKGEDFKNWYQEGGIFEGLSDADKATFEAKLTEHGDEDYSSISKKVRLASAKTNAPEGDYTPEEVVEARETLEKYQNFVITNNELQDFKLQSLRVDAVGFARKRHLKDLASKL